MSSHYTDVDRLILERWNDVLDLQDAFKELTDRMRAAIDGALRKTGSWLNEQGYQFDCDARAPEITVWRPSWEVRKQPCVRLKVGGFGPHGYARNSPDHPYLWVLTEGLSQLKMRDAERAQFGRKLRDALGPVASGWDHDEVTDTDEPLGRYLVDVTDAKRVEFVADPVQLQGFIRSGLADLFQLESAIDATLAAFRGAR